jgi:transcriptional regulator with XRE-family HTH domain
MVRIIQEGRRMSTSALTWLIGRELVEWRTRAGLSLNAAADKAGITRSKLHHLEMGRQQQAPEDIATLGAAYEVPAWEVDRLTSLTGRAAQATWWGAWSAVVPDWFKTFVGLEGLAVEEFHFEPMIIPGLLQTEEYATAITSMAQSVRPDHGERFVGLRMGRARRLTDPERPLTLHAVVLEGALRLAVGGPDTQREQLKRLLDLTALPNVTLQVIRPEDGPHSGLRGGFYLLDFGSAARPVVYVELKDGAMYLQEPTEVDAYRMVVHDLQRVAMSPEQSRELIASMLR